MESNLLHRDLIARSDSPIAVLINTRPSKHAGGIAAESAKASLFPRRVSTVTSSIRHCPILLVALAIARFLRYRGRKEGERGFPLFLVRIRLTIH